MRQSGTARAPLLYPKIIGVAGRYRDSRLARTSVPNLGRLFGIRVRYGLQGCFRVRWVRWRRTGLQQV